MKKYKKYIVLVAGLAFLIAGLLLMIKQFNVQEVYVEPDQTQVYRNEPANDDNNTLSVEAGTGKPIYIEVLDANISLSVKDGYYNYRTQQWTLSKTSAQYAVMTPKPNQLSGNTFIYGHNRENVFSNLLKVKQGSIALVTTDKSQKFIYKLMYSYTTDPDDSSFLYYEGPPQLTIQTCSGANFENRTLFVYELVGVINA